MLQTHPSVEVLTAFSDGQLSSDAAATVEHHIGECQPCCNTLLGLTSDDTFLGLLKATNEQLDGITIDLSSGDSSSGLVCDSTIPSGMCDHPRYEILELIAKGGMGDVFKARHRMMDRTVAIKIINKKLVRNPEAVERFHREVKTAARMAHPNIVAAHDAEQAQGSHFLVMEYVEGVNLAELVKASEPLPIHEACEYARQAAVGLQYAHERGMVHRDIKPHNLMRTSSGTIKILDFGLASLAEKALSTLVKEPSENGSLTAVGSIMGTPDFISPEQAADAHQADIRSDIYSLGATLHYLLCGLPPFHEGSIAEKIKSHAEVKPQSISHRRPDVTQELSDVISRMLAKNPDERFQTPRDVAIALAPFAEPRPTTKPVERDLTSSQRSSWWPPMKVVALASAALGMLLAGAIYVMTDQGTLSIDAIDESVDVQIWKVAGSQGEKDLKLSFVDKVTGSKVVRLPSGSYEVTLVGDSNEYKLSDGGFTLKRGGQMVVKVSRSETKEMPNESQVELTMTLLPMAQQELLMQGNRLSPQEIKTLASKAASNPTDIESHLQLLGFYSGKSILSKELQQPYQELVCWLIEHFPESAAAGNPSAQIHGGIDPTGYIRAKNLWLQKVKSNGQNIAILSNAAKFFLQSDRSTAEELLLKAQVLDPENADLCSQLAQLYRLGLIGRASVDERKELASKSLVQFERARALNGDGNKSSESYLLADMAKVAFDSGAIDKAKQYAERLLKHHAAGSNAGNAIHQANLVLGRIALKSGNIEQAGKYLLASAKTDGSPNLNSFGPNMTLAKELLEKGQKDVVLEYFELCGQFWKSDKLKQWIESVKNDGIPNFGGNVAY